MSYRKNIRHRRFGKFNVQLYEGRRGTAPFEKALLVEFFDATQDPVRFGPLGQFTGGRYYLETLVKGFNVGQGLCLCGHVPAWNIDAETYHQIMDWLDPEGTAARRPTESPANHIIGTLEQRVADASTGVIKAELALEAWRDGDRVPGERKSDLVRRLQLWTGRRDAHQQDLDLVRQALTGGQA